MATFSSTLTNKTYPQAPLKEFTVPNEDPSQPSIDFDAIDQNRQDRGLPPLDEATKKAMFAAQMQEAHSHQESEPPRFADLERQVSEAKKAQYNTQDRLNGAAKKRIEILCGVSRGQREVDIDGNKFLLRTLKGKEHRAAIVAAAEFDGSAHAAFEIRKQLLARAVVQITGYDLGLFVGDSSIEARLEFIDELEEPMLIKLYSEYLDLAQTTQNKYFLKTESEVKEVMQDLKK